MTSDRPRRVISHKLVCVAIVGNDIARAGHPIYAEAVRAALIEHGLYVHERGNQSLGDCLGQKGLCLPSKMKPFLDWAPPGSAPPRGWRTVRYIKHDRGLVPLVKSFRVYQWPPTPPGVDRSFLAERFIIPKDWDWSQFDLT